MSQVVIENPVINSPYREPDFGVTSANYDFAQLLGRAQDPVQ